MTMLASVYFKYGTPEVLEFVETTKPIPTDHQILVRVKAATINRTDCAMLGATTIMCIFTGLFKPKNPILGTDFAGIVESIGKNVSRFKKGDRIFGFNDLGVSSHAEYLCIAEDEAIAIIPKNISFKQAASSMEGAHYGYNMINKVSLRKGQKVLVNGATGAIGSALVQLLKHFGAEITAVCGTAHIEKVRSMGATHVFDYQQEDFTQSSQKYHYILDAVGKSSFGKCKPLLENKGVYISSELGFMAQNIFLALLKPVMFNKKVIFPIPGNRDYSVNLIKKLLENNEFDPLIDKEYSLSQIPQAFDYVLSGEKIGNVIINMRD